MDRPKRVRKPPPSLLPRLEDISDLEDDESDGDFSSASSDDYNPDNTKSKPISESESSGEDEAVASDISSGDEQEEENPIAPKQQKK